MEHKTTVKIPDSVLDQIRQLAKQSNRTILGMIAELVKFYKENKNA